MNECDDRRLPFAATQSEGEHACVIGPENEIVVEIGDSSHIAINQMDLASVIAEHLNERYRGIEHCCSSEGKKAKAGYVLHLIEQVHISDVNAMEFVNSTVEDAGATFARDRLSQFSDVPF